MIYTDSVSGNKKTNAERKSKKDDEVQTAIKERNYGFILNIFIDC